MRCLALAVLAVMLCGCAARDPYVSGSGVTGAGNWRIERQVDRITGAPSPSAQLMTMTSSNSAVPTSKPAGLQLTCFEGQPLIRFSFDFKVGSDTRSGGERSSTVFGYRFDDRPGHDNVPSRVLGGHQIVVIEDRAAVGQFLGELAGSKRLYVRIRSLSAGRTTAEFQLDGAETAASTALVGCPLRDGAAKPRSS